MWTLSSDKKDFELLFSPNVESPYIYLVRNGELVAQTPYWKHEWRDPSLIPNENYRVSVYYTFAKWRPLLLRMDLTHDNGLVRSAKEWIVEYDKKKESEGEPSCPPSTKS